MNVKIPIDAGSVFRILSIRQVVEDDVVATALADGLEDILQKISRTPRMRRDKEFLNYTKAHCGYEKACCSVKKLSEENLCSCKEALFKDGCGAIGDVFDYQIPLASSQKAGEGVVDLLSQKNNLIYVVEVKKWVSNEHPLRAMFEAMTFWKMMVDDSVVSRPNAETFINCYNRSEKKNRMLGLDTILVPAILVSDESKIYKKMMDDTLSYAFATLYRRLLEIGHIRCFRYGMLNGSISTEDFTEEFADRLK